MPDRRRRWPLVVAALCALPASAQVLSSAPAEAPPLAPPAPVDATAVDVAPVDAVAPPAVNDTPAEAEDADDELPSLSDVQADAARGALDRATTVASTSASTVRSSPALVSVMTRDDIRRLGARDLMDVLHLIPGITFGADVQGSIGILFRGMWGQEGKVLVLWDGFEINETLYLTAPVENHFPLQSIERVEVIRGPGSALYGGFAELAVINIVTRNAATAGFEAAATYGQMGVQFGRINGEVVFGHTQHGGVFDGLQLSFNAFGGEAARSNRAYDDGYGNRYTTSWDNASQGQTFLHATASWAGFTAKVLLDGNRIRHRDNFDVALDAPIHNDYYSAHGDLSWVGSWLDGAVRFSPRLNVKRQLPWYSSGALLNYESNVQNYHKIADRLRARTPLQLRLAQGHVLTVGVDVFVDQGTVVTGPSGEYEGLNTPFENGEDSILYLNAAGFAEYNLTSEIVNLTVGARYEYNSAVGGSFVPRLAATRTFDKVWVKGLISGAFKPPGIENLALNSELIPERATVYEAEVGYDILPTVSASVSAYRVTLDNPIVFFVDDAGQRYVNFDTTGSQGFDVEMKMLEEWGSITANYGYNNSQGLSNVSLYEAGGNTLRAAPEHKLSASSRLNLTSTVSVGPALVVLSERRGWLGALDGAVGITPPAVLASVALYVRDMGLPGLDGTLAVHNLLDTDYRALQAYDGGHAPMPMPGRELLARVSYRFGT
jgi:outer membrane receptor for ferrienterochelin and colicins